MFHLTALLTIVRHGEKDSNGKLTDHGAKQAVAKGLDTFYLGGGVKLFHSGVDRVQKTTDMIGRFLPYTTRDVMNNPNREQEIEMSEQRFPLTALEELHFDLDKKIQTTYFSPWNFQLSEEQKNKLVQNYLEYEDVQPERGAPSPKSLARRLGYIVSQSITDAIQTPYDNKTNYVFGTHEPVIMAFLFYALHNFTPGNRTFTETVGGSVSFAEGFEIRVFQNEENEIRLFLFFRTYFTEFTLEELTSFTLV
jgi:hypothetical protein